jgi:hypothetical protein
VQRKELGYAQPLHGDVRCAAVEVTGLANDRQRTGPARWTGFRSWRRSRLRVVKVHGLLRTGTNYVSALLGENLDLRILGPEKGGWKHGPIDGTDGTTYVVVVKSPYTWLESFYNWEVIRNRTEATSLKEFAVAPVSHPQLAEVWSARDPIDAWNKATSSWLESQAEHDVLVLRYEDVIADVPGELARFIERFPTRRRHRTPVDIDSRVGPGRNSVGPVDRGRYTTGVSTRLDPEVVTLLDSRLDPELMRTLRYAPGGE